MGDAAVLEAPGAQRPTVHRFGGGNTFASKEVKAAARAKKGVSTLVCPAELQGIKAVWMRLVKQARKGDATAGIKLIELYTKYAIKGPTLPSHLAKYQGVSPDAAALLHSLDCDLESLVRRYGQGLPCSDVEVLVAESALSMVGPRPMGKGAMVDVTVALVQELRDKGLVPVGVPEAWSTGKEVDQDGAGAVHGRESGSHPPNGSSSQKNITETQIDTCLDGAGI